MDRQECFQQFHTAVSQIRKEEEIYDIVVNAVRGLLPAKSVALTVYRDEKTELVRSWNGAAAGKQCAEELSEELACGEEELGCLSVRLEEKLAAASGQDRTEEKGILEAVCALAAMALRNARIYEAAYLASITDEVTGLYNRRYLLDKLSDASEPEGTPIALIGLNLDGFKLYNEMYGYCKADGLLHYMADIIREETGDKGMAFRFGADEFMIIRKNTSQQEAFELAERIRVRVMEETAEGRKVFRFLTVSGGIVMYPEYIREKSELLGACERAVFYAKVRGKNQIALWTRNENRGGRKELKRTFEKIAPTVYALVAAIDAKDKVTFRHSVKVSEYAVCLAEALDMKEEEVEMVREAGLLHDIGKIGIPESILEKQSALTPCEYEIMKGHVENAVEMIRYLSDMNYVLPAVVGHHERYDGKGYPTGLAGEEIPLAARCLTLADSFDTMTARRPYKEPLPVSYALEELERGKGAQFDPSLTDVFIGLVNEGKICPVTEPLQT